MHNNAPFAPATAMSSHLLDPPLSPEADPLLPNTPSSSSDSSSPSDSSSDPAPVRYRPMPNSNSAECVHDEPKRIPLLTVGDISPLVMHQWEMACEDYFSATKKLDVSDHISMVLPGLKDLCAHDWVATHCTDLIPLSFDDFMVELCREFLPEGWDDELHAKICSCRLKVSNTFMSWVNKLCHLDIILHKTNYHFNDDSLHLQLDSLIDTNLCACAKHRRIKESVDVAVDSKGPEARLSAWISELRKLAKERANDTKHYKEATQTFHRMSKREATDDVNRATKRPTLSQPSCIANSSASSSANSGRTCPPKLTENEFALLDKHQGCTKCCWGYQNHRTGNCPNSFPDPVGYLELTEDALLTHKRACGVPSSAKPVGTVMTSVGEEENDASFTVNAVMPSSVLDAGDTTEEVCAPLTSHHYRWQCQLLGPNTDFPLPVKSMIDIGAHGIFIDPLLVEQLSCHHFKLHEPCHINLTLKKWTKIFHFTQ
jgi:hypothetical protein